MTTESTVPSTPETKPCVRCRVQINAASGYCTLCGALQRRTRRAVRWLAGGLAAALVAAGVLAVVEAGGPGGGARAPLRLYRSAALTTLVPSTWTGGPAAAPAGAVRAAFVDPLDNRWAMTVTAQSPPLLSAGRRARRARAVARSLIGFQQLFFGRVRFPDGRPAWLLTYASGIDVYHALYIYSACTPTFGMSVELRAPTRSGLQGPLEQIPASAFPPCTA